jgi:hypothetical protein
MTPGVRAVAASALSAVIAVLMTADDGLGRVLDSGGNVLVNLGTQQETSLSDDPSNDAPWQPAGETFLWGDIDCDAAISPVDSLKLLRYDAGLFVQQPTGCPAIGALLFWTGIFEAAFPAGVGEIDARWGDYDCNEAADPVDALRSLRFDAGFPVIPMQGCPELGEPGTIREPEKIVLDDNFFEYEGAINPDIEVSAEVEVFFAAPNQGAETHNLHVDLTGGGFASCEQGDICTVPDVVPAGRQASLRLQLAAGAYNFQCDFHPDEMTGSFIAQ